MNGKNAATVKYFRLRYIVPFALKDDNQISVNIEMMNQLGWKKEHLREEDECDLYDYVVLSNTGNLDPKKIGVSRHKPADIYLSYSDCQNRKAEIRITDTGISLFRSNTGFFWYEAGIDSFNGASEITADNLMNFEYAFKELNGFPYYLKDGSSIDGITLTKEGKRFLLADWVEENLNLLNISHEYFARKIRNGTAYADRALLFGYASIDGSCEDVINACWHIASGSGSAVPAPSDAVEHMYIPADGQYWQTVREGCFYCLKYNEKTDYFQKEILYRRIVTNYFSLYILLLHQSCSILRFTTRMQLKLDADASAYQKGNEELFNDLTAFQTEIYTFLAKGVYTSVSHIQIINGFYEYVQTTLKINEEIRSLNSGMHALTSLLQNELNKEEEEKDKKLSNAAMGFTVMVVFSALIDATSFVQILSTSETRSTMNFHGTAAFFYILCYGAIAAALVYFIVQVHQAKHSK